MGDVIAYLGLSITSFIAGTVMPFPPGTSEMAMAGLLGARIGVPEAIIATAVAANVLGTMTNYVVGSGIAGFAGSRWFPVSESSVEKAARWFRRFGVWAIAMCWLPTFGDAITVAAGFLRTDFRLFLILVATGKLFGHLMVAIGIHWLV